LAKEAWPDNSNTGMLIKRRTMNTIVIARQKAAEDGLETLLETEREDEL